MLPCLKAHPQGTLLCLQVLPRSSRNQLVGLQGEVLKIKLTSPPVEGAANKCCCDYLARIFRLAKREVELVAGDKSRQKRVLLHGVDPESAEQVIRTQLGEA